MNPELSEFSYGFALTNELVGWTALYSAPIFPSLIEEGKEAGGYDVKLDYPAVPLYLQFKRSHCMTRRSAKEIKAYKAALNLPFYRFSITERNRSFLHTSLVELDDGNNLVFYAAPRFHLLIQINEAWNTGQVANRSVFIAPREIGLIEDDESHHIAFDSTHAYFCSDPRQIDYLLPDGIQKAVEQKLNQDQSPLREKIGQWVVNIEATEKTRTDYAAKNRSRN